MGGGWSVVGVFGNHFHVNPKFGYVWSSSTFGLAGVLTKQHDI